MILTANFDRVSLHFDTALQKIGRFDFKSYKQVVKKKKLSFISQQTMWINLSRMGYLNLGFAKTVGIIQKRLLLVLEDILVGVAFW